jgi:hypothetical protein
MSTIINNNNNEQLLQQQEQLLKKKYGGMIPQRHNLIHPERRHFDSADWSQKLQQREIKKDEEDQVLLAPVLNKDDVQILGTSPPSSDSANTLNGSMMNQTRKRTSMDESRTTTAAFDTSVQSKLKL